MALSLEWLKVLRIDWFSILEFHTKGPRKDNTKFLSNSSCQLQWSRALKIWTAPIQWPVKCSWLDAFSVCGFRLVSPTQIYHEK